jgi:hypothetical protein
LQEKFNKQRKGYFDAVSSIHARNRSPSLPFESRTLTNTQNNQKHAAQCSQMQSNAMQNNTAQHSAPQLNHP